MADIAAALYCEDVRQEEGGKSSLMGVLGPEILLDRSPPIALPKLCVFLYLYFERPPMDANGAVSVLLEMDGKTKELARDSRFELPSEFLSSKGAVAISPIIIIQPLRLSAPAILRTSVKIGERHMDLNSLSIRFSQPASPPREESRP